MRIGVVERLVEQVMERKSCSRAAALNRLTIGFGLLTVVCGLAYALAPLERYVLGRRSAEMPVDLFVGGVGIGFAVVALLLLVGRNG